jgi:hypothetical protein
MKGFNRRYLFTFFLLVFSTQFGYATTPNGCTDGQVVYPNFTGNYYAYCPIWCPANIPIYAKSGAIYIQTWKDDPKCGLKYGTFNNTSYGSCIIGTGSDHGTLVYYNPSTYYCPGSPPVNVPLDTHTWLLLLLTGCLGLFFISEKRTLAV